MHEEGTAQKIRALEQKEGKGRGEIVRTGSGEEGDRQVRRKWRKGRRREAADEEQGVRMRPQMRVELAAGGSRCPRQPRRVQPAEPRASPGLQELTSILHICTPGVVTLREPLTWALRSVMVEEPGEKVGGSQGRG